MDERARYRAVASRDRRFEGRFVVAVITTGVYCRPGCPAPIPRQCNTRFFACAAGAEEAGFRACLRCRPDASPGSPAWLGTTATVARALKLIHAGEHAGVETLAARLGVGARHLRRLFTAQLGAPPLRIARSRRAHFARKLIEETALPMAELAHAAGYESVRRFNDEIRDTFRRAPRELRATRARTNETRTDALRLTLPVKPPYDWAQVARFLAARAIPGVEVVTPEAYRRTLRVGGAAGTLEVRPADDGRSLTLILRVPPGQELLQIVERVGRLFDVRADPLAIGARLARDPRLRPLVAARPGLRVPGAWDPFESAVRAILGQQISVAAATTLAGRIVARHGERFDGGDGLTRLFPSAGAVARARLGGMPATRAKSLRGLARAVDAGALDLATADAAALCALPGIGPWTAAYLALRLGDPDALPAGDLVLRQRLGVATETAVTRRAEPWRPFRAYAVLHLWSQS